MKEKKKLKQKIARLKKRNDDLYVRYTHFRALYFNLMEKKPKAKTGEWWVW